MSNVSWLRFIVLTCLVCAACGWCGEVWTSDGSVTEGLIKIDNRGDFLVLSPSASATKIKAEEVVYAWLGSARGTGGFQPAMPLKAVAIGTPVASSISLADGVYTLKGGGDGVAGSADKCTVFVREINGNAELVARITELGAANAQVGLTVRESTEPGAKQITIMVNPAGELRVRYRQETNGPVIEAPMEKRRAGAESSPGKAQFPLQLKLIRKGRNFVWSKRKEERGGWGPSGQLFADGQYQQWLGGGRKGPEPGIGLSSLYGGLVLVSGGGAEARAIAEDVRVRDSLIDPLGPDAPDEQTDSYVNTRLENSTKGLWLRDGTFLVGATVTSMENDQVRFEDAAGVQTTLSSSKLARANLTSLSPGLASNIPADGNGVLLASGEFMDGRFGAWKDGKITVSSIVFGLSTFKFPEEAKALAWHAPTDAGGHWIVSLRDGSVIVANSFHADQMDVLIDEPLLGQRRVASKDIYVLRASSDHAVPLSTLRPQKIDMRTRDRDVIVGPCFEPIWSSWLTAGSRGAGFGVAVPVGTELTYDIPSGTRRFVCWTGSPERIGGNVDLRFIVLLDSVKAASVTVPKSKDGRGIIPLSIPISGKKTLTLRVEVEGKVAKNKPPDGYGIWGDALLLK